MSDTRPTFGQALEAAAPSESSGSASTPAAAEASAPSGAGSADSSVSDAAAATQPGAVEGSQTGTGEETFAGPVPLDRHKAILEHTRTRLKEESEAQLQQRFGWLASLQPDQIQAALTLLSSWSTDPTRFVVDALQELQAHPEYAPQLKSHAARILRMRTPQQPEAQAEDQEPPPDIVVDGHAWYSAGQQAKWHSWRENRLITRLQAELAPIKENLSAREAQEARIRAQQVADQYAIDQVQTMSRLPYFTEHKAAIQKVFAAMPPMPDEMVGQAVRDAYITVLVRDVLPTLTRTAQSDLLSSLSTKAAASTRPAGSGPPATAARPRTFEEALPLYAPR